VVPDDSELFILAELDYPCTVQLGICQHLAALTCGHWLASRVFTST